MDQATGNDAGTEDDAAIGASTYSIAGFEHGALTGHGGIEAFVLDELAVVAAGSECQFLKRIRNDQQHVAGILLALVTDDAVLSDRKG